MILIPKLKVAGSIRVARSIFPAKGHQIVISVSLDDALDGRHIWGTQYDRKASDLLSVQRELARDITGNLQMKLNGADEQKLAKNHTREATLKARESALTALSIENSLGEPHATLGLLLTDSDFDFTGAEREFRRAIELNPNYATAHQWFAEMLGYAGRFQESFAEFRRALEIDPMSLPINWNYGRSLYYARRYDESLAQLKKTVELDANFASVHRSLSYVYQSQGNYAQSIEEFAKYLELIGDPQAAASVRETFARGGWTGFLRTMTGEKRVSSLPGVVPAYFVATYYAALGEKDKAFARLNEALEERYSDIEILKVDLRLDPLRDDPRFADLVRRAGLPH